MTYSHPEHDQPTSGVSAAGPLDRAKLADAILSSALDCIIVSDSQGRIVEFNAAAERTFGMARKDMLGRGMDETIVPHQHRERHRKGMERFLAGGAPRVVGRRVEIEALHADGHIFPVELSITETRMDQCRYFVATLRDITAQKQAEAHLRETQATLRAIFDNVPAALYLRDRNDTLVMMNNWGAEFIGRNPASMIGQPMSQFREPQNVDIVKGVDENIVRTGKPESREILYHLPGGDRIGLMTFFPVSDNHGEITHIGGMLLDVTELHKARAELQQVKAVLESVFDNIPAELYLRELDGSFVMMNRWGANYYGKDPGQMVGQLASAYDTGDEIEIARQAQEKLLATGRPVTQEYHYTVDGRHVKVQNTIFPVKNADGKIVRIGGVTTDVTELHNARNQLDEAQFLIKSIFDNAPFELYLRELNGTYIMMNRWGANYVGIEDPVDMVGKNFAMFDAPKEVERSWAAQKNMIETGEPVTREFHYQAPEGTKTLQNTIFPIRDAAGRIARIGGVSIDVTALDIARDQRDEARVLIQTIFDNAPVELYLRELDGRYIMMNKWGANYFGVKTDDLLGGNFVWSYDSEEETRRARTAQATLLETGKPVTREFQHTVDGKRITAQNTIFPVRDPEGRIVRIGGISIDMTDLNHARDQLQRAQDNLHQSEKLAALGQLLAGVAHELNNPLAVVLGRASILQEKLRDTPYAAPLQKLREAADRCARIVKTFLAMARQTGPRRSMVEVNELVESALEMTTYSLRKNNINYFTNLLADPLFIEVDQDQMIQVLTNLILNAQHALEEKSGDRLVEISVSLSEDGQWLSLAVADNGPGVPAAIAARIFDPFFTTKSVGQGTGLGLSVCRSMVEAHGGTLKLETTPGGGATFRVALPAHMSRATGSADAAGGGNALQMRGRILVVDDEVEIAAILADCLTPLGIECVIAADGHSALARIGEMSFDGIFCDVSMPGMDGISFFKALRDRSPALAERLIFISGDVLHRDWDRIKSSIGRPIIEKPFDPQQVREAALQLLTPGGKI
jgi:PAS domain S-box-containing protein